MFFHLLCRGIWFSCVDILMGGKLQNISNYGFYFLPECPKLLSGTPNHALVVSIPWFRGNASRFFGRKLICR